MRVLVKLILSHSFFHPQTVEDWFFEEYEKRMRDFSKRSVYTFSDRPHKIGE